MEDGQFELAVENIKSYIIETGDFSILERDVYIDLSNEPSFKVLVDKYLPKFSIGTFFYFYVGLIGFFIAFILNLRRKTDRVANGLIGLFVFMHSFFLIHVSLYLANYTYYEPHTLSMSTIFSFLYGPVLYFYFKRVSDNYKFKKTDLLHLIPTVIFIIVFIPIYSLSAAEKLEIMLGAGPYDEHPHLIPITISSTKTSAKKIRLQKTIMIIHTIYALFYGLYGIVIIQNVFSGIFFNVQLFTMTTLVLYVGYVAYSNPQVLVGVPLPSLNATKKKYKNSGLTPSFSLELKEQLVKLLENEKVYRQNTIKLESIAQRLGTTRHNASQVINEHFGLNFFELINKYRVEEAMELLKDTNNDLNIIDIAYEVGYNNKVTFNKSFKRFCNLTPSQFAKLGQAS
jgi:AraC-like DNA-binding protein